MAIVPWWENEYETQQRLFGDIPGVRTPGLFSDMRTGQVARGSTTNAPTYGRRPEENYIYKPFQGMLPPAIQNGEQQNSVYINPQQSSAPSLPIGSSDRGTLAQSVSQQSSAPSLPIGSPVSPRRVVPSIGSGRGPEDFVNRRNRKQEFVAFNGSLQRINQPLGWVRGGSVPSVPGMQRPNASPSGLVVTYNGGSVPGMQRTNAVDEYRQMKRAFEQNATGTGRIGGVGFRMASGGIGGGGGTIYVGATSPSGGGKMKVGAARQERKAKARAERAKANEGEANLATPIAQTQQQQIEVPTANNTRVTAPAFAESSKKFNAWMNNSAGTEREARQQQYNSAYKVALNKYAPLRKGGGYTDDEIKAMMLADINQQLGI